jgi:predicted transcriptional regulator
MQAGERCLSMGHLMDLTASIAGNYVSNNAIATIQMSKYFEYLCNLGFDCAK